MRYMLAAAHLQRRVDSRTMLTEKHFYSRDL